MTKTEVDNMRRSHPIRFLRYFTDFFVALLPVYFGISLIDAFNGGKNFFNQWLILLFIGLPLYVAGKWAIEKLEKKEGVENGRRC